MDGRTHTRGGIGERTERAEWEIKQAVPLWTLIASFSLPPLYFLSLNLPLQLSLHLHLSALISYLSVHICYAILFNFVQSSINWDWGWVICEKPTVSLLISNGCLPGHLRCTEGMQKESIERLRLGAYQSSREEVKRRGKERGWRDGVKREGVEKRCIERCTQREDQR